MFEGTGTGTSYGVSNGYTSSGSSASSSSSFTANNLNSVQSRFDRLPDLLSKIHAMEDLMDASSIVASDDSTLSNSCSKLSTTLAACIAATTEVSIYLAEDLRTYIESTVENEGEAVTNLDTSDKAIDDAYGEIQAIMGS